MGQQYPLILSFPFVWGLFILTWNFSFHDAMLVYQLSVPALTEVSDSAIWLMRRACQPLCCCTWSWWTFQTLGCEGACCYFCSDSAPFSFHVMILQCFFEHLFVFFLMTLWAWQATCAAQGSFRGFNSPASDVVFRFSLLWTWLLHVCEFIYFFILFFSPSKFEV